ncbi:MAG TPA: 5'-methylthioadenosine/adenosylhomocysteine nucleosidase [Firmicutes bacterium]|nr:5'-methylthioadenosine/adenosylhomocysteine nucleosidase [Bacillota bacterium]
MIGIIGAMQMEVEGYLQVMHEPVTKKVGLHTFYSGQIDGVDCVVACCGEGKVNAALCAQSMMLLFHPQLLINSGVAGGIGKDVHIGDVVFAGSVVEHDMDITPLGYPMGYVCGIDRVEMEADEKATALLMEEARHVYDGTVWQGLIASGDQFIAGGEKMARILQYFPKTMACEMEGAAIGHAAVLGQVPFVVLRAISDNGNDDAKVDFPQFAQMASKKSVQLLIGALPKLATLIKQEG